MASFITNKFFSDILIGIHDFDSDTIKIALMKITYPATADTLTWDNLYEINIGSNYVTGGKQLQNVNITINNEGDFVSVIMDDVQWENSVIVDAKFAAIYNSTKSNKLIAVIDFGSEQSTNNETFKISFGTEGLLKLRMP